MKTCIDKIHKDLPCEVMIEVEPRCNLNCRFCFNRTSFAKKGRGVKPFTAEYVKKIIDGIAKAGIKTVRFTGGEPLLRTDIFELMKYAKKNGLTTILNTNGTLINTANIKNFIDIVDNVLIPVESYKNERGITGKKDTLSKKINAIKLLKKNKIPVVRVGTVAIKENILNFEKLARFVFDLPVNSWEIYRPISASKIDPASRWKKKDANLLVSKLVKFNQKNKKPVFIANAMPFCAVSDFGKAESVSLGARFDDGHSRLVVDPRGFVKPHYFLDKNIGDPLDVLRAWNHPFMKKMRNLEFMSKICRNCSFKLKCKGGSRYEAKIINGRYTALDPTAFFTKMVEQNKIISIKAQNYG